MKNIKCKFCNTFLKSAVRKNHWGYVCNCEVCGVYTFNDSEYGYLFYGDGADFRLGKIAIWLFYHKKTEQDYEKKERIYIGSEDAFKYFCGYLNESEADSYFNLTEDVADAFFNLSLQNIEKLILQNIYKRMDKENHLAEYSWAEVLGLGFAIRTLAEITDYGRYLYYLGDLRSNGYLNFIDDGATGNNIILELLPEGIEIVEGIRELSCNKTEKQKNLYEFFEPVYLDFSRALSFSIYQDTFGGTGVSLDFKECKYKDDFIYSFKVDLPGKLPWKERPNPYIHITRDEFEEVLNNFMQLNMNQFVNEIPSVYGVIKFRFEYHMKENHCVYEFHPGSFSEEVLPETLKQFLNTMLYPFWKNAGMEKNPFIFMKELLLTNEGYEYD